LLAFHYSIDFLTSLCTIHLQKGKNIGYQKLVEMGYEVLWGGGAQLGARKGYLNLTRVLTSQTPQRS